MAEHDARHTRPTDPVGRVLFDVSRALAIFGGFLCCGMAVMVTVSVTGRYLFSAPVPGDYDLVGIIAGAAVFAFLPYCQLTRSNVVVDFFTTNVGTRGKAVLDAIGSLPLSWNHLVGVYDHDPDAKNVHFTEGGPYFYDYAGVDYSGEWFRLRDRVNFVAQRAKADS